MSAQNRRVRVQVWFSLVAAVGFAFSTMEARSQEVTVKNDSLVDGATGAIQAGFVAGESAAAWLTSPCTGNIVAVQVFWRSYFGGEPYSIEDSITIFSGGTFPFPGSQLALLEAPVMTDGVVNEFRYLDENNTIPLSVPITQSQVFVVSFKFANSPNPLFGPSVVTDTNGCQPGKNAVYAVGEGWKNLCSYGASGDFFIRAVINCGNQTGACCFTSGSCQVKTPVECGTAGGTWQGAGTSCTPNPCQQTGACCLGSGGCQDNKTQAECDALGGTFKSGHLCSESNLCTGACCYSNGNCQNRTLTTCGQTGGTWQGPAIACAGSVCPSGACCLPSGTCLPDKTPVQCTQASGVWKGHGVTCGAANCPLPVGACCYLSGYCEMIVQSECELVPGAVWKGLGVTCEAANCPLPVGACCYASGYCETIVQSECALVPGAVWKGLSTDCSDNNQNGTADICEPQCNPSWNVGDFVEFGVINGRDIQGFVTTMITPPQPGTEGFCRADINRDGVLNATDINLFVTCVLTAACPPP